MILNRVHRFQTRWPGTGMMVVAVGWCGLVAGCNGSAGVPVSGAVTYLEKPLADAGIFFFPEAGRPIGAALDSEGKYAVELLPGQYRVIVSKAEPLPAGWKEGDPIPKPTIALPAKYTEPARTVLTATVAENQEQPIDFALE